MNLAPFFSGNKIRSKVVEIARQKFRDDATLRLARIANGVQPEYQNGHPKDAEKGRLTKQTRRST